MRIFFSGLAELRGIAAMAVVFHHIELFKNREGMTSLYKTSVSGFIDGLGKNGVYLFFVLSGFLITYLLLSEVKKQSFIEVRKFYIRRIIRIWPLYYFTLIIGLFLLPLLVKLFPEFFGNNYYVSLIVNIETDFLPKLLLFLFFLPNVALILFRPVAGLSQSWSVGVEEQFYLIWPLLLSLFKRNLVLVLVLIIVLKFGVLYGLVLLNTKFDLVSLKPMISFFKSFNIELMALGGIGAFFLFNGYLEKYLVRLKRIYTLLLIILIAFFLFFDINYFLLGILFLFLIILNTRKECNVISSNRLSFLGDISYGIYMLHPLVMFFSFVITKNLIGNNNLVLFNISFYFLTVSLTILVSYLSYTYFESRFLKLKDKFVVVPSGK